METNFRQHIHLLSPVDIGMKITRRSSPVASEISVWRGKIRLKCRLPDKCRAATNRSLCC